MELINMNERINKLIEILFDETARIDEKDDVIMCLGGLGDIRAIEPLIKIGYDDTQDYILKSSAGESIARIMIDLNIYNKAFIENLTVSAKYEAISLLSAKKPEWKQMIYDEFKNKKN